MVENHDFKGNRHYQSCGIWSYASMINHSCMSTADRAFIGDMMIVRATQDMEAGDEVTISYRGPQFRGDMHETIRSWGFECGCALCDDAVQTTDAVKKERNAIFDTFESIGAHMAREDLEQLIARMEATYTQSPEVVPRLGHWAAQKLLTAMYFTEGQSGQTVKDACMILAYLGFDVFASSHKFEVKKWGLVVNVLVEIFLYIKLALQDLGLLKSAQEAEQCAMVAYKILVGEDGSFCETYDGRTI